MNFDMDVRSQRQTEFVFSGISLLCLLCLGLTVVLTLTGCGNAFNKTDSADGNGALGAYKGDCTSQAIANRYIIRWKDGTTSVEDVENAEDFRRNIAEPFADQIAFAETDFRVQVPRPPAARVRAEDASPTPINWGVSDTHAADAWNAGAQGQGITVAIVDSGVDVTHPQLAGQLYVNPGEIPNNQVDDDRNGYIDDVSGYDFAKNTGTVTDPVGHGTHVAGIIAADPNRGAVQGMAPQAKILPLGFMDASGGGSISAAISAIQYAQAHGAKIVSASWGGDQCSKALIATIQDLAAHDILFIAAAGNGDALGNGVNIELQPEYPAAFGLANQITVGAMTIRDYLAGFSNYSTRLVNLVAPGVGIISTYPGGGTMSMDGTSMATPFVSGAAAAIWSAYPTATAAQVKQAILASTTNGGFPVTSGGRLDAASALAQLKSIVAP